MADRAKIMKEPVASSVDSVRKRRRNTYFLASVFAALTPTPMSPYSREFCELVDEVEAILQPLPTSLY